MVESIALDKVTASGASLGLKYLIENNSPVVVNQAISSRFEFIDAWRLPGNVDYFDAFVTQVNNSTCKRSVNQEFIGAPPMLKIDHHIMMDSYGNENI